MCIIGLIDWKIKKLVTIKTSYTKKIFVIRKEYKFYYVINNVIGFQ